MRVTLNLGTGPTWPYKRGHVVAGKVIELPEVFVRDRVRITLGDGYVVRIVDVDVNLQSREVFLAVLSESDFLSRITDPKEIEKVLESAGWQINRTS